MPRYYCDTYLTHDSIKPLVRSYDKRDTLVSVSPHFWETCSAQSCEEEVERRVQEMEVRVQERCREEFEQRVHDEVQQRVQTEVQQRVQTEVQQQLELRLEEILQTRLAHMLGNVSGTQISSRHSGSQ